MILWSYDGNRKYIVIHKKYLVIDNYIKISNANFENVRFTDKDLIMYFAIFAKKYAMFLFWIMLLQNKRKPLLISDNQNGYFKNKL